MRNFNILFSCLLCFGLMPDYMLGQAPGQSSFLLSGLSQQKNGKITLEYFDGSQAHFDTADIRNGRFYFKGPLDEVSQAVLSMLDSGDATDNNKNKRVRKFYLVLQPLHLSVKLDTTTALPLVSGSPDQEDLHKLQIKTLAIVQEASLLYDQMMELIYKRAAGDSAESVEREIDRKSAALAASQERTMGKTLTLNKDFINTHPGSIISAHLIEGIRSLMPVDSVEILFNRLQKKIQNSKLGKQLQSRIKAAKNSQVSRQAADFEAEDSEGKIVRLSDFSGHYVLLDFWASWCVPCRKLTPEIQEICQQFQPQLKVIYISLDTNKGAWAIAIKEDGISGKVNLRENRTGRQKESDITFLYNVQAIPAFVLIDDKGKIIYRGESTSAAAELRKILEAELK